MKTISIIFLFLIARMLLCAQAPQIKWWYDTDDMAFGNAAIADVDGDNLPEIAFSTYRNDERIIVLNAEDGSLLWDYNTGGCNDVAPIIYDVDLDGELEIVLPSSCVPQTFCFDAATGEVEWTTPTHGSDSPPTIADVDNDEKPEILHGQFNGWIICINGEDGSVLWEFNADPNSWIQTAPTILDADKDGQLDFVVANWSFGTNHKIFAFRGNDHSLIWESELPQDVMYHGASHADIDHDGYEELAIGDYSGNLYVLNAEDGSLLWDYSFASPVYIGAPTSMADLNNDELFEIVFIDWYKVGVLTSTGGLLWDYSIPGYGSSFRGAAIADVNTDKNLDVVFGTSTGSLIALSGDDGDELWTVDLQGHFGIQEFEIDHGPVIADFDNDGLLDAFVVGGHAEYPAIQNNYGRAYAVSIESAGGPDWPMFRRNIIRSACVYDTASISGNKPAVAEMGFKVFPNPTFGEVRIIHSGIDGLNIRVLIKNIIGNTIFSGEYENIQNHGVTIDLSGQQKGMYFIDLQTEQNPSMVQKILLY